MDSVLAEHAGSAGNRRGRRTSSGKNAVVPDAIGAALRSHCHRALARSGLRLAAPGLRLGAPRHLLWAVLPLVAIGVFEKIAFRTSYSGSLIKDRLFRFAWHAFAITAQVPACTTRTVLLRLIPHFIPLTLLSPGKFLSSPVSWLGLIVAAAFIAAAVRLRHYRNRSDLLRRKGHPIMSSPSNNLTR